TTAAAGNVAGAGTVATNTGALPINTANTLTAAPAVQPATIAGVMAVASRGLTIKSCDFRADYNSPYVFGAELIVFGDATGLTLCRNHFAAARYVPGSAVFGVLVSVLNANVTSTLDDARISDNVFEHLTAGLVAFTQLGMVRCTGNRVVQCGTGLY